MSSILYEPRGIVFIRVDKTTICLSIVSFIVGTGMPILIQWAVLQSLDKLWFLWVILAHIVFWYTS